MPKLRPLPEKNGKDEDEPKVTATADGGSIVDLPEEDKGGAEVELAPETAKPEPPKPEPEPPKPEPKPEEENSLAKQLEAARNAERLAQQRAQDEARLRQQAEQETARLHVTAEQAQYDAVVNAIGAQQERLDAAKRAYRAARASSDVDAETEAVEVMTDAKAVLSQLEAGKQAYEARREEMRNAPPVERRQPERPSLPKSAQDWLEAHPEYKSGVKNSHIGYVHQLVTEEEGLAAWTPKYFERLEHHLGIRKEAQPQSEPEHEPAPAPQRRSIPMSAPVSREVPSASTGRPSSTRITLTPEQVQIAHNSFGDEKMSNAEKERIYAEGLRRYRQRENSGWRDERHEQERQR